jgi:peptide/nickel transport system permease protein
MEHFRSIIFMLVKFLFVSFGLILISGFIGLFTDGIQIDFKQYILNVWEITRSLSSPGEITITNESGNTYSMFPTFWSYYNYSLIIFLASLLLATLVAFLLTFLTIQLPQKLSASLLKILSLLESIPDIFIIIIIQFTVIVTFKRTGVLLAPVAGGNDPVYTLPIVTLSILPTIFIFKLLLLLVHDELTKPYVELAESKGLGKAYVFSMHVIRNFAASMMNHMKSFILILLSNLIVFERLFNIYGITHFILAFPQIDVICFSLILFYLPIFILLTAIGIFIKIKTGQEGVVS